MSEIIQHIDPREDNQNNTDMIPTYVQHNRKLHSTLYQLLYTACPPFPGEPPEIVSLVTNSLGCVPIVAEDGKYIVKNV